MAQIIQIKRTGTGLDPVLEANTLAPATGLEDAGGNAATTLSAGELFYVAGNVTGTGQGVLYVGDGDAQGAPDEAASIIGGKAFTSMLDPHGAEGAANSGAILTKLSQSDGANPASLVLADVAADNTITLAAPDIVTTNKTILLPTDSGVVEGGALSSVNSASKLAATLQTTGKFIADSGLDATDSGIVNTGAITQATSIDKTANVVAALSDVAGASSTKHDGTVVLHSSKLGTDTADEEGNLPDELTTANENTGAGWTDGETFIFDSPKLDIDVGYHGTFVAGDIEINSTNGNITGATISGGDISGGSVATTTLSVGDAGQISTDAAGNLITSGDIISTYGETIVYDPDGQGNQNYTQAVIDNGKIVNARDINSIGTITAEKFTDGVVNIQNGGIADAASVTVTAGGNVTAPVVQTTDSGVTLDGNNILTQGNITVRGDLEVAGNMLTTHSGEVVMSDSMINVNSDGYGQTLTNDLGWFGNTSRLLDATADGAAGTDIIGKDRTVTLILANGITTFGFAHATAIGTVGTGTVDGAGNSPPITYDATGGGDAATGWQYGDTYVIANGEENANPQNNAGVWAATDKYLTYTGMAFDQTTDKFRLVSGDVKPEANWDLPNTTGKTLVSNVEGDVVQTNGTVVVDVSAAEFEGNANSADEATKLSATKTIAMTGDVAYTSAGFDGQADVTGVSTIGANKVQGSMLNANVVDDTTTGLANGPLDAAGLTTSLKIANNKISVDWTKEDTTDAGTIAATYDSANTKAVKDLIGTEATSTVAGAEDVDLTSIAAGEILSSYQVADSANVAPGGTGYVPTYNFRNQTLAEHDIVYGYGTSDGTIPNAIPADTSNNVTEVGGLLPGDQATKLNDISTATVSAEGLTLHAHYQAREVVVKQDDRVYAENGTTVISGSDADDGLISHEEQATLQGLKADIANITNVPSPAMPVAGTGGATAGTGGDILKQLTVSSELIPDAEGRATNHAEYVDTRGAIYAWAEKDEDELTADAVDYSHIKWGNPTVDGATGALTLPTNNGVSEINSSNLNIYMDEFTLVADSNGNATNHAEYVTTKSYALDTDSLSESDNVVTTAGSEGNLWFTDARGQASAINAGTISPTSGKLVLYDGTDINATGLDIGTSGIKGASGQNIKLVQAVASDSVVATFGGAGKSITLSQTGITGATDAAVPMNLSGFVMNGGVLTNP